MTEQQCIDMIEIMIPGMLDGLRDKYKEMIYSNKVTLKDEHYGCYIVPKYILSESLEYMSKQYKI